MSSDDEFYDGLAEAVKGEHGDIVKWQKIGDEVDGVITELRKFTFPGDEEPSYLADLILDGGAKATVNLSPMDLGRKWNKLRPNVGERVHVAYTGNAGKMKVFRVEAVTARGEEPF